MAVESADRIFPTIVVMLAEKPQAGVAEAARVLLDLLPALPDHHIRLWTADEIIATDPFGRADSDDEEWRQRIRTATEELTGYLRERCVFHNAEQLQRDE